MKLALVRVSLDLIAGCFFPEGIRAEAAYIDPQQPDVIILRLSGEALPDHCLHCSGDNIPYVNPQIGYDFNGGSADNDLPRAKFLAWNPK